MATILPPSDFREFLRLLNSSNADYLLIDGYAVNYYGYPRATADLTSGPALIRTTRKEVAAALHKFGFAVEASIFGEPCKIIRMSVPPLRIEISTPVSGVEFCQAFPKRSEVSIDGVPVNPIGIEDLKANKKARGRNTTEVKALHPQ